MATSEARADGSERLARTLKAAGVTEVFALHGAVGAQVGDGAVGQAVVVKPLTAANMIGNGGPDGAFAPIGRVRAADTPGTLLTLPSAVPLEHGALAEPLAVAFHAVRQGSHRPAHAGGGAGRRPRRPGLGHRPEARGCARRGRAGPRRPAPRDGLPARRRPRRRADGRGLAHHGAAIAPYVSHRLPRPQFPQALALALVLAAIRSTRPSCW